MRIERVLFYLLVGMRGGPNRIRILYSLLEQPKNANQLATDLELNYTTVRHHLDLLEEHDLVEAAGDNYAEMYFATNLFEEYRTIFERIATQYHQDAIREENETQ
jgi:DNA-binding transcriptional ArsR family regulator